MAEATHDEVHDVESMLMFDSMDASVSPMATSTQQQTHAHVGDVISAGQSTLEALM